MPHVYDQIFERYRIVDSDNRPLEDTLAVHAEWLDPPGCVFQRNDLQLGSDIRTHGIMKSGLYLSVVLDGAGEGGPRHGPGRFRYAGNQLVVMAIREPTLCSGDAARGTHMRAAGLAFPRSSIERLGLDEDFLALFEGGRTALSASLKVPPRIQAIALEMLSPTIDGHAGRLLLGAQATEILVRTLFALRRDVNLEGPPDHKRARLQIAKELMDSDLRYPWTIAELAQRAGTSRRSFNLRFRAAYGISAIDYLRAKRLDAAREALVHRRLSVAEAAYFVGYSNPANFATAFRRRFGCAPSECRDTRIS